MWGLSRKLDRTTLPDEWTVVRFDVTAPERESFWLLLEARTSRCAAGRRPTPRSRASSHLTRARDRVREPERVLGDQLLPPADGGAERAVPGLPPPRHA